MSAEEKPIHPQQQNETNIENQNEVMQVQINDTNVPTIQLPAKTNIITFIDESNHTERFIITNQYAKGHTPHTLTNTYTPTHGRKQLY